MLRLTATDQSITMTTSASGSVDYISDWTDIVNATAVTTAGSGQGNVTTAATTTIIEAPASGSSRAIKSVMISNRHGTTSNTIQLFKVVGASSYAISKSLVLLAGETVRFSDEGFCFVGNACDLEVTSATTAEQLESNATTGVMQIVGPAVGTARVMTVPDADFSVARKDAAQTFSGVQTFSGRVIFSDATSSTTQTTGAVTVAGGVGILGALNSGPFTITGTTATDGPTYGPELLSSSDWTSVGWTGDFVTGFTHTTGNTSVLSNTLAAVIGNKYQITYTITGRTAGSVTISFGGESAAGVTSTEAFGPTATTTGNLTITPTTDFNGKIVISVKQITAGSSSVCTIKDSSGNIKSEIRAASGILNTANGYQALYYNTTGSSNTANGYQSLYYNTTGNCNTANGYRALLSSATGSSNTTNGYQSLYYNTTGNYNTANGAEALLSNTTGSYNTANGCTAGYDNTTGSTNSYFGLNTGRGITTGSNNTILGANVGGLAAATTDNIVLATGQGTVRARFNGTRWNMPLSQLSTYANNAAAVSGGLASGDLYRTGGDPDLICVVH